MSLCLYVLATDAAAVECDFSMHGHKTCPTCGKTEEFLRFGTVLKIISGIYKSANHAW